VPKRSIEPGHASLPGPGRLLAAGSRRPRPGSPEFLPLFGSKTSSGSCLTARRLFGFLAAKGACGIARLFSWRAGRRAERPARTLLILPTPARGYVSEAACRRLRLRSLGVGLAASPSSLRPASRRAVLPARVSPRGSACSRRASPQRQTRPEARAHARAAFQAVRLVQKLFPPCVETVDNSVNRRRLGPQAATPSATLSRPAPCVTPERRECATKWGMHNGIRAKSANLLATGRRSGPAWTVTGMRSRYEAKTPLFPSRCARLSTKMAQCPPNCVLSFRRSFTSPERKRV